MTSKNLKKILIEKCIPKRAYFLRGGLPSECYCLNKTKGVWEVYYSERGNKSSLKTFDRETDAVIIY